ncbi:FAD-binding domain-containing protein [Lophiostoma macrostomum CBS 122681]|uniref:FAD-binding domain-containing protein n=1 Tax=Lophiostoma macrostomum CBS 122681 TaxID=1314788 RepID=A0A6A6TCU6_9PLEO|nr:FAD-binding domain-containing protein [Lophiostoma macrostomum CBS 122681]
MDLQLQDFVRSLNIEASQVEPALDILKSNENVADYLAGTPRDAALLTGVTCQVLTLILGSGTVSSTPVNEAIVDQNWSQTCWLSPTCIVQPRSSDDVSKTLKVVNFLRIRFTVRSGGHSPNPGWASINGTGILIDMQLLHQITVSDSGEVASIGPGTRWGDVYQALDQYEVSVVGGRIPSVGVAGVILGGGYFHFSAHYGLAADNVKNFEVVLADGAIVNANARSYSDLFWALKGGGPNFGIITRFDLYTIPVRDIWYQVTIHSNDQVSVILDAFVEWQQNGAKDSQSTVALIIGVETITLGLFYATQTPSLEVFAPFKGISSVSVAVPATNGTVLELTKILSATSMSSRIDAQLYKDVHAFWREQAIAINNATGANMTFVLQPIPKSLVDAGHGKGGNALGLPSEDHQWWTTLVDWNQESDDEEVRAAVISVGAKWKELSEARGLDVPFIFMNDASRDQDPLTGYGPTNLQRLKTTSAKYDPTGVLQTLQNDGFLLAKV